MTVWSSSETAKEQTKLDLKQPEPKPKLAFGFGFGLAEHRNLIFCFGLGFAEISCLAEISAETEIKDIISAEIGNFTELSKSFG